MFGRLCDELIGAGLGVHAIEMIYKGKVVLHECFDEDRAYPVYSAAKSVTSMAFSLCCDDGLLSPQTVLSDLIDGEYKEFIPTGFDKLPFQRFLTMTAGNFPFHTFFLLTQIFATHRSTTQTFPHTSSESPAKTPQVSRLRSICKSVSLTRWVSLRRNSRPARRGIFTAQREWS